MVLVLFCAICHYEYKHGEEVFSIRCGHVFHHKCASDWFLRSCTCPDCRAPVNIEEMTKITLVGRNVEENLVEKLMKVKSHLDQSIEHENEVKNSLKDIETKCSQVQNEFDTENDSVENLKGDMQRLKLKRENLENLLGDKINVKNEVSQELQQVDFSTPNPQIIEKNRMIEELKGKLYEKTAELQKEVRNSTKLIIEKMKLQQQLDNKMHELIKNNIPYPESVQHCQSSFEVDNRVFGQSVKVLDQQLTKCDRNNFAIQSKSGAVAKKQNVRLDKELYNLFKYAKNLEKIGFSEVAHDNNAIYVKRGPNSPKIKIIFKEQVDELLILCGGAAAYLDAHKSVGPEMKNNKKLQANEKGAAKCVRSAIKDNKKLQANEKDEAKSECPEEEAANNEKANEEDACDEYYYAKDI